MTVEQEWEELLSVKEDKRYELHLNGSSISKKLEQSNGGLPSLLYELTWLNYIEIADTTLTFISDEIKDLPNLIHLALHRNEIEAIPETLNNLQKLKFLDVSFNSLKSVSFPFSMPILHTLNLSNNSIESLGDISALKSLSILHLEHNDLENIPEGFDSLVNLTEFHISNNSIKEIPHTISQLKMLRVLDASENNIKEFPTSLSECRKLKSLILKSNPLKDNRLRKMTVQCNAKAILDYIAKNGAKSGSSKEGTGKNKKKGKAKAEPDIEAPKITIIADKTDERRIITYANVKDVRPFICCLLISKLDITDPDSFKKFISMQTKLHENECEMRTRATIATHCADKLEFPLHYRALETSHLRITPLGKTEECSAASLIERLKEERDALQQKKKRQPKTGLYKFIELVDGKEVLACLKNGNEVVISLPPMTNSDITKAREDVIDVFVEITSPLSLADCKYVMESLIKQMIIAGLNSKTDSGELHNGLIIEPLRVVDEEGDLRCLYPSRVDLQFKGIEVERVENRI